jgi:hypothetical protein
MKQRIVMVLVALAAAGSAHAHAQQPVLDQRGGREAPELERIREAVSLEAAGDLPGAEAVVLQVLDDNPSSLTALLALERLTNVQGRPGAVLPAADRLISEAPASAIGHQVRLRARARLGDPVAIDAAARAWIRAAPHLEAPYREAALVWRERAEPARAIAVLEEGRRKIDRPDALALELGDTYSMAGDLASAAAEWARAVGPDGRGFLAVQRRMQNQPDGGARAIPPLVDRLSEPPQTTARLKAATVLAIDAGLEDRAQRLAREMMAGVTAREREPLLVEVARRADGARLYRVAAWSYGELLRDAREVDALLAIRTRVAELALLSGDTAAAAEVYRQLESASAPGSPQRRQAMALRIQLTAREGDAAAAAESLAAFRAEYPAAPEADRTAAVIAARLLDAGELDAAEHVLAGVDGPAAARVRGRAFIRAGDLARARAELLAAAPLLHGVEATETIALAALLMRVSPEGGELVARAVAAPRSELSDTIAAALRSTERLPRAERAAVLDFMAAMADRAELVEDADALRREIVATLPRTAEAPGALLALARRKMSHPGGDAEATVLLERLIVEYPRSALAPRARQELERLRGRGPVF